MTNGTHNPDPLLSTDSTLTNNQMNNQETVSEEIGYKVDVFCTNCGFFVYSQDILKGKLVRDAECQNCGNKTLLRLIKEEEEKDLD